MKKINILVLLFFSIMLSACIMPVVPRWDPDIYNDYKVIQAFQKKDTIGHTDVVQRKQDLIDCGVINFFGGNLDLTEKYPGMNTEQVIKRNRKIYACMKAKNYTFIGRTRCTENGKPLGICN